MDTQPKTDCVEKVDWITPVIFDFDIESETLSGTGMSWDGQGYS